MTTNQRSPAFVKPAPRNILGVDVTPLKWGDALSLFERLIETRQATKVTFLNAHNANLVCRDPKLAAVIGDFLVLPDGIGVDIGSKILHGSPFPDNLNGTDFVPAILEHVRKPLRIGLLGATRQNVEEARRRLSGAYPNHEFIIVSDGYFDPADEPEILKNLENARLDILLVAMGVPRQELWIAKHIRPNHATLAFAVGALIDFEAGAVPRAPKWMRLIRMEWVFRLAQEPTRLWRRYILGNPEFLLRILRQRFTGETGVPGKPLSSS